VQGSLCFSQFLFRVWYLCAARKLVRLKRIEAGEPGWQGTAWAMERQYPDNFARPEIQLNLGRASADSLKREHMQSWL